MSIDLIGSASQARLNQQTVKVGSANDGDADDKKTAATGTTSGPAPAKNDGDRDDATLTAKSRLSGPSQAALLQLQSDN
jgi:hypothetical protein